MTVDGIEQVIAYGSKKLSGPEANWSATEGECWAVVYFTKHWKHFLLGRKFTLITDHAALKYIMTAADTSHKWQRWALKIRDYDFEVKHRAGKDNSNADGLSRLQYDEGGGMQPDAPAELAVAMMLQLVAEEIPAATPKPAPVPTPEEDVDVDIVVEGERAGGLQICRVCQKHHPSEEFIRCTATTHTTGFNV